MTGGVNGKEEETRIDERVTHPFIRPPERSLHGSMCSDRLGREMSTTGRVMHG